MKDLENNNDLFEYTKDLKELKNKLFDPKQYSTLFVSNTDENEGAFDSFFAFVLNRENSSLKEEALAIFKKEITTDNVVNYLTTEVNEKKRAQMLSVVWEANLDATKHLSFWIDCAIKGSFEECIEIVSIIENIEVTLENTIEIESQQQKLNVAKNLESNYEKAGLLDALEDALNYLKA